ncbi:DUF3800 domain-containing protein [Caloramator sp. CAR-1]|uniref:DUF3800 domain-containing protein n=1 Tax=Caloramator sp. CAR-1 TaxID=3062777 RepID=UPI0026E275F0|nr:DUF3800 domain-containing protein [Caloramator sp. CAR-1]MDO6355099.1 DUF3800 domain-containing protein [Caloramator sp. CAR-1]
MYFVYIDEAGQPGGYDNSTQRVKSGASKYFTLAGILIPADDTIKLQRKLKLLKLQHNLPTDKEFKWNAKYSQFGIDKETYISYREGMVQLINEYKNSVIVAVIDKDEAYKKNYINNHHDVYVQALHLIMERVQKEINDRNLLKEPVMFMFDSRKNDKNSKLDEELQLSYIRATGLGTYYMSFPYFSETPIFVDSDYSAGVQLADYCAGITHRAYEAGKSDWFEKIKPALRKSKTGNITGYGLKVFP